MLGEYLVAETGKQKVQKVLKINTKKDFKAQMWLEDEKECMLG